MISEPNLWFKLRFNLHKLWLNSNQTKTKPLNHLSINYWTELCFYGSHLKFIDI